MFCLPEPFSSCFSAYSRPSQTPVSWIHSAGEPTGMIGPFNISSRIFPLREAPPHPLSRPQPSCGLLRPSVQSVRCCRKAFSCSRAEDNSRSWDVSGMQRLWLSVPAGRIGGADSPARLSGWCLRDKQGIPGESLPLTPFSRRARFSIKSFYARDWRNSMRM